MYGVYSLREGAAPTIDQQVEHFVNSKVRYKPLHGMRTLKCFLTVARSICLDKKEWIVGGFQFGTENDAKIAKAERGRIEHLEGKLDYDNPQFFFFLTNNTFSIREVFLPLGISILNYFLII